MAGKAHDEAKQEAEVKFVANNPALAAQVRLSNERLRKHLAIVADVLKESEAVVNNLTQLNNDRMGLMVEVKELETKRDELRKDNEDIIESMHAGHRSIVERLTEREKSLAAKLQEAENRLTQAATMRDQADVLLSDAKRKADGVGILTGKR